MAVAVATSLPLVFVSTLLGVVRATSLSAFFLAVAGFCVVVVVVVVVCASPATSVGRRPEPLIETPKRGEEAGEGGDRGKKRTGERGGEGVLS